MKITNLKSAFRESLEACQIFHKPAAFSFSALAEEAFSTTPAAQYLHLVPLQVFQWTYSWALIYADIRLNELYKRSPLKGCQSATCYFYKNSFNSLAYGIYRVAEVLPSNFPKMPGWPA